MSTRQLAAIMFADIVGYTSTMEGDESLALRQLSKLRQKLDIETQRHQGRILEFRGDGALCAFNSTLEGVKAALALQLDMQIEPSVPLRIAIHSGDVMIEGDTIYGDGVNVASRMETLAVPGSIFISGRVHDDIKNHREIRTVKLGKFCLKNVREDMDLYAINHPGIHVPKLVNPEGKGSKVDEFHLLVLPFVNLSQHAEQEYLSDGMTEELISFLSRLKDIKVISRTTSMKYKGTQKDVRTIAKETGAIYILEGSVRSQREKLRITAQIIDARKDLHLWAETYQGTMEDIFDIQEQVARKIADALRLHLTRAEKESLKKRYTDKPEAYQLYLQGRYFWNKRNIEGLNTALRFFNRAIEADEEYALAWVGIADTYSLLVEYSGVPRRELNPKAREAVEKALALDPGLAEAHISLGSLLKLNDWDWVHAENEFKIGLELNPDYATGHHWYAELLLFTGRHQEALQHMALAVELDPVSVPILKDQGILFYYTRQYDKGIQTGHAALELDSHFIHTHRLLSLCYTEKGMYDEALLENDKWSQLMKHNSTTQLGRAYILARAGRQAEARSILEAIQPAQLRLNDARNMGLVYTAMGEIACALDWFEKSLELHEESLCGLTVDPKMDPVRSEARYRQIVKRMGLPL